MYSAVSAASSATGTSLLPAVTTATPRQWSDGLRLSPERRATPWWTASGSSAAITACCSGVMRENSTFSELPANARAMVRSCSSLLPGQ